MPVAVKVAPLPRTHQSRKSRVVRVSAKRPKQDKREKVDDDEVDFTDEAVETEAKPQRPDNGTYLSMYFRDMAALDVLRPEEEFTSAREIETLEIMLWEAVLSHPPVIARLLEAIATVPAYTMSPELKAL